MAMMTDHLPQPLFPIVGLRHRRHHDRAGQQNKK
jgi:hypothetical protein